ncbi:MAG: hypothetical protein AAF909_12770 [Pseudomonadota bacterium]
MAWGEVFGELWFWGAAAILWLRAALSLYGAPRRLIAEARGGLMDGRRDGLGPAAFAFDLVRWRLGPGQATPQGLVPLRLPLLGGAAAYCLGSAAIGDMFALAVFCALGPIAAVTLGLEPRVQAAVDKVRAARAQSGSPATDAEGADASPKDEAELLGDFMDTLEQAWRLRMASTAAAVLLTLVAATATRP